MTNVITGLIYFMTFYIQRIKEKDIRPCSTCESTPSNSLPLAFALARLI